jgi:8-oxo-dGTP diphosphatase
VPVAPLHCPDCGAPTSAYRAKAAEPPRARCAPCDRVHYTGPRLAAGVLARVGDALLFVRRAIEPGYGLWVYPGGFVDDGESPAVAAVREAREEAGVDVDIDGLLGVYHHGPRNVVIVVFTGRVVGGEPSAKDESLEVALWRPQEIEPAALAFDTTREAVRDYRERWRPV